MASCRNLSKNQNASKAITYDSPLVSLPVELVTLVASHLDFTSTLSLATALPSLYSLILESSLQWQLLLSKIPWTTNCAANCDLKCSNKQLVEEVLAFLPSSSFHHFNDFLVSICSNSEPKHNGDWLEVEVPSKTTNTNTDTDTNTNTSTSSFNISPHGFLLLAAAEERKRKTWPASTNGDLNIEPTGSSFKIENVSLHHSLHHPVPSLLQQLALAISTQKRFVASFDVELVSLHTGGEAECFGRILKNCETWRVEDLELVGQVILEDIEFKGFM